MADQTSGTPAYADARRRYRLDTRIATGGMGEVWRATDTVLDRVVAVKRLLQGHGDDPVFRRRFETEARHAAGIHHPGVAQVFDFGAGDDAHPPFLVMELVDGRPLSAILRPGQPMHPEAAAGILAATADALGAAHAQGIVHRDVKPANILVTGDRRVKITDFGIARAADEAALTRTGEVLGTPQYLSPEQAEGRPVTPASDVYSLGAVAYECLTGQRPFQAENPLATALAHLRQPVPELPSTVPPALAAVCRRAMAKAPDERYADGTALAAAFREALATPGTPPVEPVAEPVTEPVTATAPVIGSTLVLGPAGADPRPGAAPGPEAEHSLEAPAAATAPAAVLALARRVPVPVWAAAGVLVVVVAVAAFAGLATSTGNDAPGTDTTTRQPSTPPSSVPSSSSSTPHPSTASPPAPGPKQPKPPKPGPGHHGHGHQHGKGHQ